MLQLRNTGKTMVCSGPKMEVENAPVDIPVWDSLFPETKGRTLDEVRRFFDGEVEEVEVSEVRKEAIETIH